MEFGSIPRDLHPPLMMISLSQRAAALFLFVAGGSALPSVSSVAALSPSSASRPCDPGSADSTAWRLVTAKSFTFCVPSTWRVEGQTATFQNDKLRWGTGDRPRDPRMGNVTSGRIAVDKTAGSAPPSNAEVQRLVDDQLGITRETETIDDHRVELTRSHRADVVNIGATWMQPRIWFVGEATSNEQANVQLAMIRSVRFTTQ
jgi:hypothetical protein